MWITHYYNGIMIAYDLLCDCDKVHLCKAASAQTPRASAPLIKRLKGPFQMLSHAALRD